MNITKIIACLLVVPCSFAANIHLAQAARSGDRERVRDWLKDGADAYDASYSLGMQTVGIDFGPYAYDKEFFSTPPFFFIRSVKIAKDFVEKHNVDLSKKTGDGTNFIHHLIADTTIPLDKKRALIRYACQQAVDVNGRDNAGETPAHRLLHITESLCDWLSCSKRSYVGWANAARREEILSLITLLKELGADLNIENNEGNRPIDNMVCAPYIRAILDKKTVSADEINE